METVILPIHLLVLTFTAWQIFKADHLGFTWMRGRVKTLDAKEVKKYHYRTWAGLILMIITGFTLFWPMREFLLTRPQFFVKMTFVAALLLNSFAIGVLQKTATERPYSSLSLKEKLPLFISGAVSTLSWLGAAAGGFFLIPE